MRTRPTQLILIRHGETPWTRERRYQGRSDTSLTAEGLWQARRLADAISRYPLDLLYTSSLRRAKQTAAILSKKLARKPHVDRRLNELFFGRWEGRSATELGAKKDRVFEAWCRGKVVSPPGGESLSSLRRRTQRFLRDCLARHRGKTIAVVSHGGPIKTMIFDALRLPRRSLWSLRIDPASVSVLSFYPDFVQLVSLNRTLHLPDSQSMHKTAAKNRVGKGGNPL